MAPNATNAAAVTANTPSSPNANARVARIAVDTGKGGQLRLRKRQLHGHPLQSLQENNMSNHIYKHIELTGSSTKSIEDAVDGAIAKASQSVRNIHWFEVVETRGHVENGKVAHWQVTIKIGFTLED